MCDCLAVSFSTSFGLSSFYVSPVCDLLKSNAVVDGYPDELCNILLKLLCLRFFKLEIAMACLYPSSCVVRNPIRTVDETDSVLSLC